MRLTTLTTNLLVSLIILSASTSLSNATSFPILDLENKVLTLELTPAVGGRISHFSLKNHRNFIKVGKLHILAQRERSFWPSVNTYSGFTVNNHTAFSVNDFRLFSGMSVHT